MLEAGMKTPAIALKHRDCNAAQAHCGGGASPGPPTRDQVGPFAARAEAEMEMTDDDPNEAYEVVVLIPFSSSVVWPT